MEHRHYCAGCNNPDRPHDPETCCGGDADCPAWGDEPDCPRADDGVHHWGPDDAHCLGPEAFRFVSECERCGMLRVEEYRGPGREFGMCDRRSYAPGYYTVHVLDFDRRAETAPAPGKLIARCVSAEEAAAVARARAHDFRDGTCVYWPDGTVDYGGA
jgi:hypothetical protein